MRVGGSSVLSFFGDIMEFSELQALVEVDLKIDDTELDLEAIRTPQLHSKYLNFYTKYTLQLKRAEDDRKTMYKDKWEYYTGKAPAEAYADKPFDLKILKNDVQMYIEADEEYQLLSQKEAYLKSMVEYTNRTLQQITNRSFTINNAIKWKMFLHGE